MEQTLYKNIQSYEKVIPSVVFCFIFENSFLAASKDWVKNPKKATSLQSLPLTVGQAETARRSELIYYLLINILTELNHINYDCMDIERSVSGKPYIRNKENISFSEFNISHTKNKFVVAISNKEVGVDMESIQDIQADIYPLTRMFNNTEVSYILHGKYSTKLIRTLQVWVSKEAIVKLLGIGITSFFRKFSVVSEATGSIRDKVYINNNSCYMSQWQINGDLIAIATHGTQVTYLIEIFSYDELIAALIQLKTSILLRTKKSSYTKQRS